MSQQPGPQSPQPEEPAQPSGAPQPEQSPQPPGAPQFGAPAEPPQAPPAAPPPYGWQQPAPPPYQWAPPAPSGPSKTISVLALIFGGVALLLSLIPIAGLFLGGLFGVAAIVLGIIGLFKSHRVFAVIGIVLAVIGLVIAIVITFAVGRAADEYTSDWESDSAAPDGESGQEDTVAGLDPADPLPAGSEITTGAWSVVIGEVTPDATDQVLAENELNAAPQEGYQYYMFWVDATYNGTGSAIVWYQLSFGVYIDSTLYADFCPVVPDDLYEAPEVYAGGTSSGNMCLTVPTEGVENAVISVQDYWSSGDRYFVSPG